MCVCVPERKRGLREEEIEGGGEKGVGRKGGGEREREREGGGGGKDRGEKVTLKYKSLWKYYMYILHVRN